MTVPYKLNDAVLLSREREGIIRYIGNVHFSKGIWCGIELIGGSSGTNDGKFEGRRYFTCARNRGLFCKIGKVRRKFREKDHSAASRQKRKASLEQRFFHKSLLEKVVQSELEIKNRINDPNRDRYRSKSMQPNDRYFTKGKVHNNKHQFELGNIQIRDQRKSRKQRSQTKPNHKSKVNWLSERLNSFNRKQHKNNHKPFKPGPRDIGRVSGKNWTPIEYEEKESHNNNKPSWMNERLYSPSTSKLKRIRSKSSNQKTYKAGPRDIGRVNTKNNNWTPIELSKEEQAKLMVGEFLADRQRSKSHAHTNTKGKKNKNNNKIKAGPRDIGRNSGKHWKPIELSKEQQRKLNSGTFLDDRRNRKRSKSAHPKIVKAGPRDIGRNRTWKQRKLDGVGKKNKSKKFKIAINEKEVNPKQLTKSKAKNKALMKGVKRSNGKKKGNNNKSQTRTRGQRQQKVYKTKTSTSNINKRSRDNNKNKKKYKNKNKNKVNDNELKDVIITSKKSKHQSMFDSFRRKSKGKNKNEYYNHENEQRASMRVQLNTQNKAKKSKHGQMEQNKKRQSAQYSNTNSKTASNKKNKKNNYNYNAVKYMPPNNQRASAYNYINKEDFVQYNPNANDNDNDSKNDYHNDNDNDNDNTKRHASATNESEAEFDLNDEYEHNDIDVDIDEHNMNDMDPDMDIFHTDEDIKHNMDAIEYNNNNNNNNKRPSEHVYELFGVEIDGKYNQEEKQPPQQDINEIWTPKASEPTTPINHDFNDNDNDIDGIKSGSVSPSGHAHIYEGNISPSGHDNIYDLFNIDEQNEQDPERCYNKPLPAPPNKPLPKVINRKGRIKGIDKYVGKWIVSFKGMKPNISESKQIMNIANSRHKRRTSSSAKKFKDIFVNSFTYSIYKDGSVQIQPKSSFGWNGTARVMFDEVHQRFEIRRHDNYNINPNGNHEYEYILINRNGTLHIEHFNQTNGYKTPFIGTGIKG